MIDIDTARVAELLEIAERCSGHSGKLSALQGWAIGELIAINAAIKESAAPASPAPTPPPADDDSDDYSAPTTNRRL